MPYSHKRWILPDGVQETLPPDARAVENLRHDLLQTFYRWGYELVMPAMIEYRDALLTGTANDLEIQTFALVDQLSGRQMGVRADMTPQVARIDAHLLADGARDHRVARLCYCGHLLHALGNGIHSSRTPLQIGAEIFGSDAISADLEIVSLMITTLHRVGLQDIAIDIGHVGVFRALAAGLSLEVEQENRLFDMLQRKSIPDLRAYLQSLPLSDRQREQIAWLAQLNGDAGIIGEARQRYAGGPPSLFEALDKMEAVVASLQSEYPNTPVHCDLSELRGYSYHTGLVFAAFMPGLGREIARGGRYDDVGGVFGNARPATGFSADLLSLYQLCAVGEPFPPGILAPDDDDPGLRARIAELRAAGETVVVDLSQGKIAAADQQCNRRLLERNGQWAIEEV